MDREELIISAKELKQPSKEAAKAFSMKKDILAINLNEELLNRKDLERLIGPNNQDMLQDNSRNMARFMNSIFTKYDPVTFVETVAWVFRAYRSHGFQLTYWSANLDTVKGILEKDMEKKHYDEIEPFFEWLIVNIPSFVKLSDESMEKRK